MTAIVLISGFTQPSHWTSGSGLWFLRDVLAERCHVQLRDGGATVPTPDEAEEIVRVAKLNGDI